MTQTSGIYAIKNTVNGFMYIGNSKNAELRWTIHRGDLRKNKHTCLKLQEDWNTFGEDVFRLEVIEELPPTKRDLWQREQHYLSEIKKLYNNSTDMGENLKLGPQVRDKGKKRCNVTILPQTYEWLHKGGNASGRIDELVGKVLSGALVNSNSPSPALAEALNKISDLEQALKRSQARVAELEEIVEAAKETVKNMVPAKSNMVKGLALTNLRDLLREYDG